MYNMLSSIFSGILSGLISTRLFWWYNNKYLSPKIKVSKEIGYTYETKTIKKTDKNGKKKKYKKRLIVYRIMVSNESKRDAYDIRSYIRIKYNGIYATIKLPYLPVLHGKIGNDPSIYERALPFQMTEIKSDKIERYKNPIIQNKYKQGNLTLTDFNDKDMLLEIIILATDGTSGVNLRITTIKYSYSELMSCIKEGEHAPGTLSIIKNSKE